ncbi:MAG: DNA-binding protein WhiA [Oscillospiraceae bacterium]|nr:DNA-binding protein WhiA [Oscillospiraceae bacterium]
MSSPDLLPFSSELKKYICSLVCDSLGISGHRARKKLPECCSHMFLYAALLFAGEIATDENEPEVRSFYVRSENPAFLEAVAFLFIELYGADAQVIPTGRIGSASMKFVCLGSLQGGFEEIEKILSDFGYDAQKDNFGELSLPAPHCPTCAEWFLRGVFLACGTVLDPKKGYHLEMATPYKKRAENLALFLESLSVWAKRGQRKELYTVYIKDSEKIEDFLTLIGAPSFAMEFMQEKIEREIRNNINRINNYDNANLIKTVDYSSRVMQAIRILRESGRFYTLPDALINAALLREQNPESTLRELCDLSNPPITKSGLNHRFQKLILLAFGDNASKEK